MTPWTEPDVERLRTLWGEHGGRIQKIANLMGRTRGSIDGKSRTLGLQFHGGVARVLAADHPAILEKRTVFPSRVVPPDGHVLKSGDNQRKLGGKITKGLWKGQPIFSLSLEERATCPSSCKLYFACFANNMGHAKRYEHGSALLQSLTSELEALSDRYPRGFVVRLHLVGDFYSVEYVHFWVEALRRFPALKIFGYTAWKYGTAIGNAVTALRDGCWERFAVRTSGGSRGPRTAVVEKVPESTFGIPCPAQHGKTKNCGTCGLCWAWAARDRVITFDKH